MGHGALDFGLRCAECSLQQLRAQGAAIRSPVFGLRSSNLVLNSIWFDTRFLSFRNTKSNTNN